MDQRIKELAKQVGIFFGGHPMNPLSVYPSDLERFAELIRADEVKDSAEHYLGIMRNTVANAILDERDAVEQAVLREREACAKLCESMGVHPALNVYNGGPEWYKRQKECAEAIRQRGEK